MPYEIAGTNGVPVGVYTAPGQPIGTTPGTVIKQTVRVIVFAQQNNWSNVRLISGPAAGGQGWVRDVDVTITADNSQTLDAAEVNQLFLFIRNDARFTFNGANNQIPYHFPKDGCFARAEVMTRFFKTLGYLCDKEFVISWGGLRVNTPYGGDQSGYGERLQVEWWYHVAPVLYQKVASGPKPTPWVIDPSVATGPVSPADWANAAKIKPVANEMSYEQMRKRLEAIPAYPTDETWLVRSGGVVYSPPSAADPRNTVEATPDNPSVVLADKLRYVPAHEVIAGFDALFRACFSAMSNNHALRNDPAPVPNYTARFNALLLQLNNLTPELRKYIRESFPKFLQDWQYTFVGAGIQNNVDQMMQVLNT